MMSAVLDFLYFAFVSTIVLGVYFAPTIIAHKRMPLRAFHVFNINLFLGWTVIGWIAILIWVLRVPQGPNPALE